MLQGFTGHDDEGHYLVLTADDDGVEAFQSRLHDILDLGGRDPVPYQYLTDERLKGFGPCYIIDGLIADELPGLIRRLDVKLLSRLRAKEAQEAMLDEDELPNDNRTIRKFLGLDENDPWATPVPEKPTRKADETTQGSFADKTDGGAEIGKRPQDWCYGVQVREGRVWARFARLDIWEEQGLYPGVFILPDLLRARLPPGWLTEERANDFQAQVHHTPADLRNALTDLGFVSDQSIWTDGACDTPAEGFEFEIEFFDIDEVLRIAKLFRIPVIAHGDDFVTVGAQYAGNLAEALQRRSIAFDAAFEIPPPSPPDILARRPFKAFYRLDLEGLTLETALDIMTQAGYDIEVDLLGWGETDDLSWLAVPVERLAKEYCDLLVQQCTGITTEIYRADTRGIRQDPKPEREAKVTLARPWDGTGEWARLSDGKRDVITKGIQESEFLFTARYDADHKIATVYFVPETFFNQHGETWGGNVHECLEGMLPRTFIQVSPGVYRTPAHAIDQLIFNLCRAGFRESNRFRMYLNNQ